jgi:predicted acetyltransferase
MLPGYADALERGWAFDNVRGAEGAREDLEAIRKVLGHIGYGVVPWKQRRGYATRALGLMLGRARAEGLDHVELTTDPENEASQKVMLANGAMLVERFTKTVHNGGGESLRFRIDIR